MCLIVVKKYCGEELQSKQMCLIVVKKYCGEEVQIKQMCLIDKTITTKFHLSIWLVYTVGRELISRQVADLPSLPSNLGSR